MKNGDVQSVNVYQRVWLISMGNPNQKWMRTGGSPMDWKPPSEFYGEIDGFRFRFSQQIQSVADWLPTNYQLVIVKVG